MESSSNKNSYNNNLQILLPETFDLMVTFLAIENDTTIKGLPISKQNQEILSNVSAKFASVVSTEFRNNMNKYSTSDINLKDLNNSLAFFVESLPEIIVEIILGIAEELTHSMLTGKNILKITDQFSVAINLLYLARQFDNALKDVESIGPFEENIKQTIIECAESITSSNIKEIYIKLGVIHNSMLSKSTHMPTSSNFIHYNIMGALQDQIRSIDLSNTKEKKIVKVNNTLSLTTISSTLNILSTIISFIDTSSLKLLQDSDLNIAIKTLFFSNGLIARFCSAIAKDLQDSSKYANLLTENFTQKIQNNITFASQKIIASQIEEIFIPLTSNFILSNLENPIRLNYLSNKLITNYDKLIVRKSIDSNIILKFTYNLAINFKGNLSNYNGMDFNDGQIKNFITAIPLINKEKTTTLEKFKILAFPITSFSLSGLEILSEYIFENLSHGTPNKNELISDTFRLFKTIDKEFKNNNQLLVEAEHTTKLDQAIEVFFSKLPELGLEILDIVISTCLHWAFKMPSLLKTFDKLFTTLNFLYLSNKYQNMTQNKLDIEDIKIKLLDAFEILQSGDIKNAQEEFDLISNQMEQKLHKDCVIYNFAHYKTLLSKELLKIDKIKSIKFSSKALTENEISWINKLSSGFSMLSVVISQVDFSYIVFNKDAELNDAIKSLLVENGFCSELFASLSRDIKLTLTKGSMLTNNSFESLLQALTRDAEKIILPELLEILLPVVEEVLFNISGTSHVIEHAMIEWLCSVKDKNIECQDNDNGILSTLINVAEKIQESSVLPISIIIDDFELSGNSIE